MRFRHYSQISGNWTTIDPIIITLITAQQDRARAYAYLNGRPISRVDYFGLWETDEQHLQNCIVLQFPPFAVYGNLITCEISVQICKESFDTKCCIGSEYAKECINMGLKAEFSTPKLDDFALKKLEKLFNLKKMTEDTLYATEMVGQMFLGAAGMALATPAKPECRYKGKRWSVDLCLGACLIIASAEACAEFSPRGLRFHGGITYGFCGAPSVMVSATGTYNDCH